jgi:DNA polymerase-3 subunit alpha
VDLKRVGKRPLEMLARSGAFDALDRNRHRVLRSLDALVAYSAAIHEQKGSAQVSLFGEAGEDLPEPRLPDAEDWMPAARLAEEHHALGFYFSGHPLDDYMSALKRKGVLSYVEVEERARARRFRDMDGGRGVATAGTQEPAGHALRLRGAVGPDRHLRGHGLFRGTGGRAPHAGARHQCPRAGQGRDRTARCACAAETVQLVDEAVAAEARGFRVFVNDCAAPASVAQLLARIASDGTPSPRGPVYICAMAPDFPRGAAEVEALVGEGLPVSPQIKGALKSLPGVVTVEEV